jgi:hypothetical protein
MLMNIKKAIFAFAVAVGMSVSVTAWAYPDEDNCMAMAEECAAGDQRQCDNYRLMDCTQTLHPIDPTWP